MRLRARKLSPQPWPWPGRPRILVEHRDEADGLALASSLRQAGYAVAVCPGPERSEGCPLVGSEGCAVAHGADVIVSSLGLERPGTRDVLWALRTRCPGVPLIVEVAPGQEDDWPNLLQGCDLIASPVAPEQLVAAVHEALAKSRPGIPEFA